MADPFPFASDAPTYVVALRQFALHEVDFVVCGGVACLLQGGERNTEDVDLCVRLEHGNLQKVIRAAHALNMQPRIPEPIERLLDDEHRRYWIEHKHAMVYTLVARERGVQIDIFLHYPIPFDRLKARANARTVRDISVLISSKEDLIEAKLAVQPPRKNDLRDIEDMRELLQRERSEKPHSDT